MHAGRGTRAAAVAAVLLAIGLILHHPPMPELRVGPRAVAPPPASALASAIAWPPAAAPLDPDSSNDAALARKEEDDALRDALFGRLFASGRHFPSASKAPSVGSSRRGRTPRKSPPSAKTNLVHAAGSRLSRGASRRENREPAPPRPENSTPVRAPLRRAPLASGPAAPDEAQSDGEDEDRARAVDPRRDASRPDTTAWTRRRTRDFPLFRPPRRAARPPRSAAGRRRVRPLLLSKLLGRGALRPPPASIIPPDLSRLKGRKPLLLPDGSSVPARAYELDLLETQDPRRARAACRRREPHWDAGLLWHDDSARGQAADARWLWLWKEKSLWWALPDPSEAPLLHHRGLWWRKQRGVWFALHEGELWSWRRFADWDAEGLIRLGDGVELVYSADFTKVAVITPGAGAVLYDAATGAELGEWLESELPRRRPRTPAELRLPRGI